MRLFIAAELPDSIREALAETSAVLRDCVHGRFVASDSFHVTLAFLGEVPGARIPELQDALDVACASHRAFSAQLSELGCFGKRTKATLWQGFQDQAPFASLATDVRSQLTRIGFEFDAKPFRPHITLMRAADLSSGVLPACCQAEGTISYITLFSSDLSGKRPIYTALHSVSLER
ncbi:MAG: RNA 2',3'-cyclic phosphodiesterase [Eggerthellaceae bacterium]|nr:RNA 2',3'-cyclic phosphodiesterase [Eggerthellaceae bacterium]